MTRQKRIASAITRFAGSMPFVYVHAVMFAVWMFWLEKNPWPALTLVVSLEAIFLSTFIMIGQNLQADKDRESLLGTEEDTAADLQVDTKALDLIKQIAKRMGISE